MRSIVSIVSHLFRRLRLTYLALIGVSCINKSAGNLKLLILVDFHEYVPMQAMVTSSLVRL